MATQPWLSEREITGHQAIRLIESQFTELSPVQLHLLGIGWDNTVFQVNHRWTFRFPRRQIALPLMATEWKLLADLSMYLDIPVPVPHFKGQATIEFPWPFVGYGMVEGQTACRVSLTERQRQRMAPRLGAILRHLHDFSPRKAQELALPPDTMGKVDLAVRGPQTKERLHQTKKLGLVSDIGIFLHWLDTLPSVTPPERPCCLVHGDLYVRHLIVNDTGHLSGIIDWGDAHLGDPATDLAIVYSFLPPQVHADFWHTYGLVNENTHLLARLRALFHSLALLLYAHDTEDADLLREAQLCLGWLRTNLSSECH